MALHRFFVFGVLLLGVSVSQALRVDRVEEQAVESVAGVAASVEDAAPKRRRNSTTNRTSLLSKPKVAGGDETWKWHEVEASGIVPNAREGHTMVAVEDFLVLFGGCYLDKKCFNDVHLYVPTTRRWLKPYVEGIPPAEREGHTATLVGAVMYIFGGSSQLGYLRDVASLNLQPQVQLWKAPVPLRHARAGHEELRVEGRDRREAGGKVRLAARVAHAHQPEGGDLPLRRVLPRPTVLQRHVSANAEGRAGRVRRHRTVVLQARGVPVVL